MPQSESDRLYELATTLTGNAIAFEQTAAWLRSTAEEMLTEARRKQQQEEAEKQNVL